MAAVASTNGSAREVGMVVGAQMLEISSERARDALFQIKICGNKTGAEVHVNRVTSLLQDDIDVGTADLSMHDPDHEALKPCASESRPIVGDSDEKLDANSDALTYRSATRTMGDCESNYAGNVGVRSALANNRDSHIHRNGYSGMQSGRSSRPAGMQNFRGRGHSGRRGYFLDPMMQLFSESFGVMSELFEQEEKLDQLNQLLSCKRPDVNDLGVAGTCGRSLFVPADFTFLDICSAPGGFSSFLLSHEKCSGGYGITLPQSAGGLPMVLNNSRYYGGNYSSTKPYHMCFLDLLTQDIPELPPLSSETSEYEEISPGFKKVDFICADGKEEVHSVSRCVSEV